MLISFVEQLNPNVLHTFNMYVKITYFTQTVALIGPKMMQYWFTPIY